MFSGTGSDNDDGDSTDSTACSHVIHFKLKHGRNLISKDIGGKSDPYVCVKLNNEAIYKTDTVIKTLDPVWGEEFSIKIASLSDKVVFEVLDWNRFIADDFMGTVCLNLDALGLNQTHEIQLPLQESLDDEGPSGYMGYLVIDARIELASGVDAVEPSTSKIVTEEKARRTSRRKNQTKFAGQIVNITLVEGRNFLRGHHHIKMIHPYVKFKIGKEKYKSKAFRSSEEPRWMDRFDLNIVDESKQVLEITVKDKTLNRHLGDLSVDLSIFERERTYSEWYELDSKREEQLHLIISITGTLGNEIRPEDQAPTPNTGVTKRAHQFHENDFDLGRTLEDLHYVGYLEVRVYRATGVAAADLLGSSDPFCIIELVNARLRTQSAVQTLNPVWNNVFYFKVKDLHSILYVEVHDEDFNRKMEFLGKVGIPLLKMKNNQPRWYALKDDSLYHRAKGQIKLEFRLTFNPVRALYQTFQPIEEKYVSETKKFKPTTLVKYANKIRSYGFDTSEITVKIQKWLSWTNPTNSIFAFMVFECFVWLFQPWMLPLALLFAMIHSWMNKCSNCKACAKHEVEYCDSDTNSDKEDQDTDKEKKSVKQTISDATELLTKIQKQLEYFGSLMDRVKNVFHFGQPFLSYIAMFFLFLGTLVLYFVPIRVLLMLWGVKKFSKKLRDRTSSGKPSNEVLNFLHRVPTDKEQKQYAEFEPDVFVDD